MMLTICREIMREEGIATIPLWVLLFLCFAVFMLGFFWPGRTWRPKSESEFGE